MSAEEPLTLFDVSQWTDASKLLSEEAAKLPANHLVTSSNLTGDDVISAPECGDRITDTFGQDYVPFEELQKQGLVQDLSKLTEDEVIDVMDVLLDFERQFLKSEPLGCTTFACYHLQNPELFKDHPVLAPFMRSILKFAYQTFSVIASANVRDGEDEFSLISYGVDLLHDTPVATVVAELDDAVKTTENDAIKYRLQFRKHWLRAVESSTSGKIQDAQNKFNAAKKALAHVTRPMGDKRNPHCSDLIFSQRAISCLSVAVKWNLRKPAWDESISFFDKFFADTAAALEWTATCTDAFDLMRATRTYMYRRASLLARSIAMHVAFDTTTGGVLGMKKSINLHLYDLLAERFGAPYYRDLNNTDIGKLQKEMAAAGPAKMKGGKPNPSEAERRYVTINNTRRWVMDTGRLMVMIVAAQLMHLGRAHRRLMNLLMPLWQTCILAMELDLHGYETHPVALASSTEQHPTSRGSVLSALLTEIAIVSMQTAMDLTFELKLITGPELLPAMFLRNMHATVRSENIMVLHTQAPAQSGLPPAAATRVEVKFPSITALEIDASRAVANASYLLLSALGPHLPELKAPEGALQTTETIFMHRFINFTSIQRPSMIPFPDMIRQSKELSARPLEALKSAASTFKSVGTRCNQLMGDASQTAACKEMAKTIDHVAKVNAVAASMLHQSVEAEGSLEAALKLYNVSLDYSSPVCPILSVKLA